MTYFPSIGGMAGTTAQFNGALSDGDFATLAGAETLDNKTLTTPSIASLANATHNHTNAAGGGTLAASAVGLGSLVNVIQSRVLHYAYSGANVLAAETDLCPAYSMPGGTMAVNTIIRITAFGTTAANGNTKTVRLRFGGTEIGRPINNVAANNASWAVNVCYVIGTGAATQNAWVRTSQNTTNALGTNENANNLFNSSPTETLSGVISIRITGQGTVSNDVLLKGFIVEILN